MDVALAKRDLAEYGVARLRDQTFDAVLELWHRRRSEGWTQKRVAELIGRDPGWVSKNLRAPGNWTLRTAGELIQALGGEAEIRATALEDPPETLSNYNAYDGYLPSHAADLQALRINDTMTQIQIGNADALQIKFGSDV